MPVRAGSFNANFAPKTLDAFKQRCKAEGKQYTKVLERLAEVYLTTNGAVLSAELSVPPPVDAESPVKGRTPPLSTSPHSETSADALDVLERLDRMERDRDKLQQTILSLSSRVQNLEETFSAEAGMTNKDAVLK